MASRPKANARSPFIALAARENACAGASLPTKAARCASRGRLDRYQGLEIRARDVEILGRDRRAVQDGGGSADDDELHARAEQGLELRNVGRRGLRRGRGPRLRRGAHTD